MPDKIDDYAFDRDKEYREIADRMYNIDYKGLLVQGFMSFVAGMIASFLTYVTSGLTGYTLVAVFAATFLPNLGLKVTAEYIKKRALIQGLKEGYKEGRKDSDINDSTMSRLITWANIYNVLNSASFVR